MTDDKNQTVIHGCGLIHVFCRGIHARGKELTDKLRDVKLDSWMQTEYLPRLLKHIHHWRLGTALQTRVPVFIKVRDVNDNAPEFAMYYETFVCENVKAGQVWCVFDVLVLLFYANKYKFQRKQKWMSVFQLFPAHSDHKRRGHGWTSRRPQVCLQSKRHQSKLHHLRQRRYFSRNACVQTWCLWFFIVKWLTRSLRELSWDRRKSSISAIKLLLALHPD